MKTDIDPPTRRNKSIRLKDHDYSQAGGYFLTIVTHGREHLFGDVIGGQMRMNAMGRLVQECWEAIPDHFSNVSVDMFTVMPHHVHGIIFIHESVIVPVGPFVGASYDSPLQTNPHGFQPGSLGAMEASAGGRIEFQNIVFGANWYDHICCYPNGQITATGNYSISSSPGGSHIHCATGEFDLYSVTVTLVGSPAWGSTGFAYSISLGFIGSNAAFFSGACSDKRYVSEMNSIIQTWGSGANYFLGDAAGSTATGGQYACLNNKIPAAWLRGATRPPAKS